MRFDYFYPEQAEQFAFFRIPKALFRDRQFKNISTDAKVLYGLMLDRVSLSVKNQWIDQKGRVYIIFTLEEIMEELGCANQKATKLVVELEEKAGLIERKRQGLGKPTLIYVKNFSRERAEPEIQPDSQTHENHGQIKLNLLKLILIILIRSLLPKRSRKGTGRKGEQRLKIFFGSS